MNLSVKDAARLLQVSEKTIYRWIKQDAIPAYRLQGQHRFNRSELVEWATARRMGLAPDAYSEPESAEAPLPPLVEALETGGITYRLHGSSRDEVLRELVANLRLGEEVDRDYLTKVLIAREELASTGIGDGIALPHPRNPVLAQLNQACVNLAFLETPVDFGALDGQPVRILFTVLSPTLRSHLQLLSKLGFALRDTGFFGALQREANREEIFAALSRVKQRFTR